MENTRGPRKENGRRISSHASSISEHIESFMMRAELKSKSHGGILVNDYSEYMV